MCCDRVKNIESEFFLKLCLFVVDKLANGGWMVANVQVIYSKVITQEERRNV